MGFVPVENYLNGTLICSASPVTSPQQTPLSCEGGREEEKSENLEEGAMISSRTFPSGLGLSFAKASQGSSESGHQYQNSQYTSDSEQCVL